MRQTAPHLAWSQSEARLRHATIGRRGATQRCTPNWRPSMSFVSLCIIGVYLRLKLQTSKCPKTDDVNFHLKWPWPRTVTLTKNSLDQNVRTHTVQLCVKARQNSASRRNRFYYLSKYWQRLFKKRSRFKNCSTLSVIAVAGVLLVTGHSWVTVTR
jgi:hypothetical protein